MPPPSHQTSTNSKKKIRIANNLLVQVKVTHLEAQHVAAQAPQVLGEQISDRVRNYAAVDAEVVESLRTQQEQDGVDVPGREENDGLQTVLVSELERD